MNNKDQDDYENGPVRRYRRRSKAGNGSIIAICVLSVAVVLAIIGLVLAVTGKLEGMFGGGKTPAVSDTLSTGDTAKPGENTGNVESATDGGTGIDTAPETNPETISGNISWTFKDYTAEDVAVGDLVLIDATHPYTFPASSSNIVSVYGNKNNLYSLSSTAVQLDSGVIKQLNAMIKDFYEAKGHDDLMLLSGYRTFEYQQNLFDKYGTSGNTFAGGCSDYHCGKSFYLKAYILSDETTADGKTQGIVRELDSLGGDYNWIAENAHVYGFIMRYPSGKTSATGTVTDGQGHYRYVGIPHAYAMFQNNWCLEEYLTNIKNYTYAGQHLKVSDASGVQYEIFYVPATIDGTTRLPVPSDKAYTVSGNNSDGFIVSVTVG